MARLLPTMANTVHTVRQTAAHAEGMKHVVKVLKRDRSEAAQKAFNDILCQQGKVAPIEERDKYTGRLTTKWIGSFRGGFGDFMEPPKKASMTEGDRRRRADAKQKRDTAAYAALAREERR